MTAPSFATFLADLLLWTAREHRLVVWFDPDRAYEPFLDALDLREVMLARHAGSLIALRRAVADRMTRNESPDLVIWVPLAEADTDGLLTPYTALGVILAPGQQPWQRNTGKGPLAARFLKEAGMSPEGVDDCRRRVENGQLSLSDLDELVAQRRPCPVPELLANAFGTADPAAIIVRFLTDQAMDTNLTARGLVPDLAELVSCVCGAGSLPEDTPSRLRQALARHLLVTALISDIGEVPIALTAVPRAADEYATAACLDILDNWQRADRDRGDAYFEAVNEAEHELGIAQVELPFEALARTFRFPALERRLFAGAAALIASAPAPEIKSLAWGRRDSRNAARDPNLRTGWTILAIAEDLIESAATPPAGTPDATGMVREYAGSGCAIDRNYRWIEHLVTRLDSDDTELVVPIGRVVQFVREQYMRAAGRRSEAWTAAFAGAGWRVPGIMHQTKIYTDRVAPAVENGRTGYVLVDALRYEMGQELAKRLEAKDAAVELVPAIAALPTLTPIGMGALLPGAEARFSVLDDGGLAVSVQGNRLSTRAERIAYLERTVGKPIVVCTASDLLPQAPPGLARQINEAGAVVVTVQDIDELGESDNLGAARRYMNDVIRQLRNVVRALGRYGCRTVIIAADHGHLFAEALGEEMKVDPPAGERVALHRRVWIGRDPSPAPGCAVLPGEAFAASDPALSLVVPVGLGILRVPGGGRAYFHGGTALEEVVIPVLTVSITGDEVEGEAEAIKWTLAVGHGAIQSRMGTVEVQGRLKTISGPLLPARIRVEVRHGGEIISTLAGASCVFDLGTSEVVLDESPTDSLAYRPAVVYLRIDGPAFEGTVEILLLDAETGRTLARLANVPIAMMQ